MQDQGNNGQVVLTASKGAADNSINDELASDDNTSRRKSSLKEQHQQQQHHGDDSGPSHQQHHPKPGATATATASAATAAGVGTLDPNNKAPLYALASCQLFHTPCTTCPQGPHDTKLRYFELQPPYRLFCKQCQATAGAAAAASARQPTAAATPAAKALAGTRVPRPALLTVKKRRRNFCVSLDTHFGSNVSEAVQRHGIDHLNAIFLHSRGAKKPADNAAPAAAAADHETEAGFCRCCGWHLGSSTKSSYCSLQCWLEMEDQEGFRAWVAAAGPGFRAEGGAEGEGADGSLVCVAGADAGCGEGPEEQQRQEEQERSARPGAAGSTHIFDVKAVAVAAAAGEGLALDRAATPAAAGSAVIPSDKATLYALASCQLFHTPCPTCPEGPHDTKLRYFELQPPYRMYCKQCPEAAGAAAASVSGRPKSAAPTAAAAAAPAAATRGASSPLPLLLVKERNKGFCINLTPQFPSHVPAAVQRYVIDHPDAVYVTARAGVQAAAHSLKPGHGSCRCCGWQASSLSSSYCSLQCWLGVEDQQGFRAWVAGAGPGFRAERGGDLGGGRGGEGGKAAAPTAGGGDGGGLGPGRAGSTRRLVLGRQQEQHEEQQQQQHKEQEQHEEQQQGFMEDNGRRRGSLKGDQQGLKRRWSQQSSAGKEEEEREPGGVYTRARSGTPPCKLGEAPSAAAGTGAARVGTGGGSGTSSGVGPRARSAPPSAATAAAARTPGAATVGTGDGGGTLDGEGAGGDWVSVGGSDAGCGEEGTEQQQPKEQEQQQQEQNAVSVSARLSTRPGAAGSAHFPDDRVAAVAAGGGPALDRAAAPAAAGSAVIPSNKATLYALSSCQLFHTPCTTCPQGPHDTKLRYFELRPPYRLFCKQCSEAARAAALSTGGGQSAAAKAAARGDTLTLPLLSVKARENGFCLSLSPQLPFNVHSRVQRYLIDRADTVYTSPRPTRGQAAVNKPWPGSCVRCGWHLISRKASYCSLQCWLEMEDQQGFRAWVAGAGPGFRAVGGGDLEGGCGIEAARATARAAAAAGGGGGALGPSRARSSRRSVPSRQQEQHEEQHGEQREQHEEQQQLLEDKGRRRGSLGGEQQGLKRRWSQQRSGEEEEQQQGGRESGGMSIRARSATPSCMVGEAALTAAGAGAAMRGLEGGGSGHSSGGVPPAKSAAPSLATAAAQTPAAAAGAREARAAAGSSSGGIHTRDRSATPSYAAELPPPPSLRVTGAAVGAGGAVGSVASLRSRSRSSTPSSAAAGAAGGMAAAPGVLKAAARAALNLASGSAAAAAADGYAALTTLQSTPSALLACQAPLLTHPPPPASAGASGAQTARAAAHSGCGSSGHAAGRRGQVIATAAATGATVVAAAAARRRKSGLGPHPATIPWHERVYEHVGLRQRLREKGAGAWWRDCQLGEQTVGFAHKR